jgi:hypothetical protein
VRLDKSFLVYEIRKRIMYLRAKDIDLVRAKQVRIQQCDCFEPVSRSGYSAFQEEIIDILGRICSSHEIRQQNAHPGVP